MKVNCLVAIVFLFALLFRAPACFAVDDTAANLVAEGRISLSQMIDALNHRYPKDKEVFWNVSGIAYHDFSGVSQSDVIIGLSGYRDKGLVYNNEKQLVEDAGSAFAYFHKTGDDWVLKQVEESDGKKYEGFEGADLTGQGKDELVVYSSTEGTKMATVYQMNDKGIFEKLTQIKGYGMGPHVEQVEGKTQLVDFQRALINQCEDCQVYYGRPYQWDGHHFLEQADDYLDHVRSYDPSHSKDARDLAFFEGYLNDHPKNFCAAANCFELSKNLGLQEKADRYRKQLLHMGGDSVDCKYCDEWLMGKNIAYQEQYLEQILGIKKKTLSSDSE